MIAKLIYRHIAIAAIFMCANVVGTILAEELKAPTSPNVGLVSIDPGESLVGSFSVYTKVVLQKENVDRMPTFLQQPMPSYSSELLNAGVPGKVIVSFVIGQNGLVESAVAQEATHTNFARDAVAAVSQWRFSPPQFKAKPIALKAEAIFIFSVYQADLDVILAPSRRYK